MELLEFPEKGNRGAFCHANEGTFWKVANDGGWLPGGTNQVVGGLEVSVLPLPQTLRRGQGLENEFNYQWPLNHAAIMKPS